MYPYLKFDNFPFLVGINYFKQKKLNWIIVIVLVNPFCKTL